METINIHEAKTHLSRWGAQAAKGESFISATAGKPRVKGVPLDPPEEKKVKRIGFLEGQGNIPDDFDRMFEDEIAEMFYGKE